MATPGWKAWADVEEDDVPLPDGQNQTGFTTGPDENGIVTSVTYQERDGGRYKVTKKLKKKEIQKRTNRQVTARLKIEPFGDEITDGGIKATLDDEFFMEMNQQLKHKSIGDDEKFWEESINISEQLMAINSKKKWDANMIRMDKIAEKEEQAKAEAATQVAQVTLPPREDGRYVPPGMRNNARAEQDKAKEETTLRVTNLSEDVRDGDLQNLFSQFGRLARVFLAKYRDGEKEGQSKGFAFVTFHDRKDAENAKNKLHGHGYDNLILQVNWAKPRV